MTADIQVSDNQMPSYYGDGSRLSDVSGEILSGTFAVAEGGGMILKVAQCAAKADSVGATMAAFAVAALAAAATYAVIRARTKWKRWGHMRPRP